LQLLIIVKENIFMAVRGEGLKESEEGTVAIEEDKTIYLLHPNCAIDQLDIPGKKGDKRRKD
jgi:DNA replication licensing factor MCM6